MNLKRLAINLLIIGSFGSSSASELFDSFIYSAPDGRSGLHILWKGETDTIWQGLPDDRTLISSDFGPWGSHKKMFNPRLFLNAGDSLWTAVWDAIGDGSVIAIAQSPDLINWKPQKYLDSPLDMPASMRPSIAGKSDTVNYKGKEIAGYLTSIPKTTISSLLEYSRNKSLRETLYNEQAKDDPERFADLIPPTLSIVPNPSASYPISNHLIGIFFEDINYGADGGLYAELIQNRDFEYSPSDRGGDEGWHSLKSWRVNCPGGEYSIQTDNPVHSNNSHYLAINSGAEEAMVINNGFDGIPLKKGKKYNLSLLLNSFEGKGNIRAQLVKDKKVIASTSLRIPSGGWKTVKATLRPKTDCDDAQLMLTIPASTRVDMDMVSLFPADTYKKRDNGLREDLATLLADIKPKFVRFPGGCVAHGDGIDNIYDWKGSIGPLETRKPLRNLWGYHQTRGLGYHEYFQFCEDIDAEPLPVLSAGVPCQNSGTKCTSKPDRPISQYGQQQGIDFDKMDDYIQDILDLIEYANGPIDSKWGSLRAANGHPAPFNMKFIGIGNEDMITEVFEPRFEMIYNVLKEKHPEITVIGTVGPFYEGSDYTEGWDFARRLGVPMVDEHYYVAPGWLIYNRDFYDKYPRDNTKVYLGEYAAHLPGRQSNVETALADALYLTDVERNGDVVAMTSYAPLLAKKGHTQWKPDMIYFDNTGVSPTVEYFTQKLFGNNSGDKFVPAGTSLSAEDRKAKSRVGSSIVYDSDSGEYILKIVNMLPVPVKIDMNPAQLGIKETVVKGEQIAGMPEDTVATPSSITLDLMGGEIPPYSMTVVRMR